MKIRALIFDRTIKEFRIINLKTVKSNLVTYSTDSSEIRSIKKGTLNMMNIYVSDIKVFLTEDNFSKQAFFQKEILEYLIKQEKEELKKLENLLEKIK